MRETQRDTVRIRDVSRRQVTSRGYPGKEGKGGRLYIRLTDCWPKIDQAAKQEEEQHKANEMK